jgi:hypothetical protein
MGQYYHFINRDRQVQITGNRPKRSLRKGIMAKRSIIQNRREYKSIHNICTAAASNVLKL